MPLRFPLLLLAALSLPVLAADPPPPQLGDLYLTDAVTDAVTLGDGKTAFYIRQRVDPTTRGLKASLWKVDADGRTAAVEAGEPDAFGLQLSPDGRWLLFHSTRPFADGRPAFEPAARSRFCANITGARWGGFRCTRSGPRPGPTWRAR